MSDNKWMFEAKRLDSGELIEFSLGDCVSHSCVDWFVDRNEHPAIEIDPSTIKPLFTTDKPDSWLFKNINKLSFKESGEIGRRIIATELANRNNDLQVLMHSDEWRGFNDSEVFCQDAAYRVRAPGYSIDDEKTDFRNATEEAGVFDSSEMMVTWKEAERVLTKFAKANCLGNNDE